MCYIHTHVHEPHLCTCPWAHRLWLPDLVTRKKEAEARGLALQEVAGGSTGALQSHPPRFPPSLATHKCPIMVAPLAGSTGGSPVLFVLAACCVPVRGLCALQLLLCFNFLGRIVLLWLSAPHAKPVTKVDLDVAIALSYLELRVNQFQGGEGPSLVASGYPEQLCGRRSLGDCQCPPSFL